MKHNIEFKNLEPDKKSRGLIERLIKKLEKNLRNFSSELVFLRAMVEFNPARTLYQVSLRLDLPGKTLAARTDRHELTGCIRDPFLELERQLEKHKSSLRREHEWKRVTRRSKLRKAKASPGPVEERNREKFFELVTPHLNRLYHFMRHVIRYSEAMGDLARGELTAQDVGDAALVRTYSDYLQGRLGRDVKGWLIRAAIDELDAQIIQLKSEREITVPVELDVPETPPTEWVSTLGDEILDFYQPDEDLKLEDVVPDLEVPSPEEEVERMELQNHVRNALAGLPGLWRRVLLSCADESRFDQKTKRILDQSRSYLYQRLLESGCTLRRDSRTRRVA